MEVNDHTANSALLSNAGGDISKTDFTRVATNGDGQLENAADDELPDIDMTEAEASGRSVDIEANSDSDPSSHQHTSTNHLVIQADDENSPQPRGTNKADTSPLAVGVVAAINGEHSDKLTVPTDPEDMRKSPRKSNKKQAKQMALAGKVPDSGKQSKPDAPKKKKGEGLKEQASPKKRAGSEASDKRGGKVKKTDKTPAVEQNKDSPKKNKEPKSKTDKAPAVEQNKDSPKKNKEPKSKTNKAPAAEQNKDTPKKNKEPKSKTDKAPAAEQNKDSPREKNKEPKGKTDKTPAPEQMDVSSSKKSEDKETTIDKEEKPSSEPNTFKTIDRLEERTKAEERAIYKSPDFMRFELLVQRIIIEEERRAHERYSQVLNETRRRLMNCVPDGVGDSRRLGSRIMSFFFRHPEHGQGDSAV